MNDLGTARRFLTKRRLAIITSAIAGVIAIIFLFALFPGQPSYQGKSVDGWLQEVFSTEGIEKRPLQALREMGPAAVPFQIQALAKTDSRSAKICRVLFRKMPWVVQKRLPRPLDVEQMRWAAHLALSDNPATKEFMPELVRLLDHKDPDVRRHASAIVARHICAEHKQLIPVLIAKLHKLKNWRVRQNIVIALQVVADVAEPYVPELMKGLNDPDPLVRSDVQMVLDQIEYFRRKKLETTSYKVNGPDR